MEIIDWTRSLSTTVQYPDDDITPRVKEKEEEEGLEISFIVALVCFGVGGLLLIIAFIKLMVWYVKYRKHRKYSKWWLRQLEHRRYLEEYSIRTGDHPSQYGGSLSNINEGFEDDEPVSATMTNSKETVDTFNSQQLMDSQWDSQQDRQQDSQQDRQQDNLQDRQQDSGKPDSNMNDIMHYL